MYDVNRQESFDDLERWISLVNVNNTKKTVSMILGIIFNNKKKNLGHVYKITISEICITSGDGTSRSDNIHRKYYKITT